MSRGIFGPNDYFGETALLRRQGRGATATAEAGTLLLRMSTENFRKAVQRFPMLKERLQFVAASRTQQTRQNFAWLLEDESIYYLSRKNWIVLARKLLIPVLVLAGVLLAVGVLISLGSTLRSLGWLGILPLAISIGWVVWRWVDWGNDFYIITSKRVVWLEKVVALYDSRQETAANPPVPINYLDLIRESNERMIKLVNDLLDVSRTSLYFCVLSHVFRSLLGHADMTAVMNVRQTI